MTADSTTHAGPANVLLLVTSDGGQRRAHLASYLTPERMEQAEGDANRWIKSLRHAQVDGRTFRDRFTYRGDSLWWFAELYLHKTRTAVSIFATLLAAEALIDVERPSRLTLLSGDRTALDLTAQVAARFDVPCEDRARRPFIDLTPPFVIKLWARFHAASALLRRLRRPAAREPRGPVDVVAFVHSAFWREAAGDETYIGPVLRELSDELNGRLCFVGVGPRTSYRARGWKQRLRELGTIRAEQTSILHVEDCAPRRAVHSSRAIWRQRLETGRALLASRDLRRAAHIRGCDAWSVVSTELIGIAHLQFPWSALAMDEAAATLERLRPKAVVTYAEAGGWGRAILLEARRRAIPTAGLQHGFISRHWLNYQHEPDEMLPSAANPRDRGFPAPDKTLVYDRLAADRLIAFGAFPPHAVALVGNPRLDALVGAARRLQPHDIENVRRAVGARPGQHLVVLAAKRIPEFDATFEALAKAVSAMPDVHLTLKPHPAETRAPYDRIAARAPNVTVAPAAASLVALTSAARLIATVNSTVAIEAMALDVPAMAMRLPNYLTPFVDAGAMAGTTTLDEIPATLDGLIHDEAVRSMLAQRRRAFMTHYGMAADGRAARRAAEHVLAMITAVAPDRTADHH